MIRPASAQCIGPDAAPLSDQQYQPAPCCSLSQLDKFGFHGFGGRLSSGDHAVAFSMGGRTSRRCVGDHERDRLIALFSRA
jgi:hypothetical protein